MQNNLKIAITGGIGSGKSTVSRIISDSGFTVVSCDEVYKKLLNEQEIINLLVSEFGDVTKPDGQIDRSKLASLIFSDAEKLEKLNNLTHPLIMQRVFEQAKNSRVAFFCEVPLLFESGLQDNFDKIIVVLRDKSERIKSVVERDNLTEFDVEKRIKCQIDYDNGDFTQYYVIHNDGNLSYLSNQIADILKKLELKT